ncbi:hypothetical protein Aglo03_13900 [Actinokineospora globicatena]|uniref:Uncharacterized protein n=1 Tax=Actinokineospora globicatena TaxID=103729 RepID=A0A9W6V842_9PSEU|nr:hypothetical protein Aglo03_13900 [Actinokineospora globicatena]
MFHYVVPAAGASRLLPVVLRAAEIHRFEVREPYLETPEQVAAGPFEGQFVNQDLAERMVLAAAADDTSFPHARLQAADGQYLMAGLDGEVFLGVTAELAVPGVEAAAWPPRAVEYPEVPLDPPLDDGAWRSIAARVASGPLFALERWALGPFGERGHLLRGAADVARLSEVVRPRAGLAVFSAELLVDVASLGAALDDPLDSLYRSSPSVVYPADDQPWLVRGFHLPRELPPLLAPGALLLVAPPFDDWEPPAVECYVRPEPDGTVRSGLAYHIADPD